MYGDVGLDCTCIGPQKRTRSFLVPPCAHQPNEFLVLSILECLQNSGACTAPKSTVPAIADK
jgi:hypothetical protein